MTQDFKVIVSDKNFFTSLTCVRVLWGTTWQWWNSQKKHALRLSDKEPLNHWWICLSSQEPVVSGSCNSTKGMLWTRWPMSSCSGRNQSDGQLQLRSVGWGLGTTAPPSGTSRLRHRKVFKIIYFMLYSEWPKAMRVSIFVRTAQSQLVTDLDISNRKEILHRAVSKVPPLPTVCGDLVRRTTPVFS